MDPLDGTTNFLHGIPLFCVSIALERDGEMVCGLIYNPILDELYTAEKGQGAFVNSRRLRVAARKTLADCVIATGIPHRGRGDHDRYLAECKVLMEQVSGIRRTGAAAIDLAWVAAGRFDGYVEHGLQPWDLAAGMLLVREAGGYATDAAGGRARPGDRQHRGRQSSRAASAGAGLGERAPSPSRGLIVRSLTAPPRQLARNAKPGLKLPVYGGTVFG